jgi:hypothetical protein
MSKHVSFTPKTTTQKECNPGPNPIFDKKQLRWATFIQNSMGIPSSDSLLFGCEPGQFLDYSGGKYCCVNEKPSEQKVFDFVNEIITLHLTQIEPMSFNKYKKYLPYLQIYRDYYITNYPHLKDNLKIPDEFKSLNDWIKNLEEESFPLDYDRSDHIIKRSGSDWEEEQEVRRRDAGLDELFFDAEEFPGQYYYGGKKPKKSRKHKKSRKPKKSKKPRKSRKHKKSRKPRKSKKCKKK